MAKRITISVAGSGKTTRIVNAITPGRRTLILTYTNANITNLIQKVTDRFGAVPENVTIRPLVSFLYTSCFRPYLHDCTKETGLIFTQPQRIRGIGSRQIGYYVTPKGKVFSCRLVLALQTFRLEQKVAARIGRFFDHVFVDEVQDLAGRDFDFLGILANSAATVDLVGDFFQHTYDSSRDGVYNQSLHNNFTGYLRRIIQMGYVLHPDQLTKSYRCSPTVCGFVSRTLGIQIDSHRTEPSDVRFIGTVDEARRIMADNNIIKLFYQKHYAFGCFSKNWGDSKGEDCYKDVCVVLNETTAQALAKNRASELPASTKNKLYVAITRARGHVFFLPQSLLGRI